MRLCKNCIYSEVASETEKRDSFQSEMNVFISPVTWYCLFPRHISCLLAPMDAVERSYINRHLVVVVIRDEDVILLEEGGALSGDGGADINAGNGAGEHLHQAQLLNLGFRQEST